MAVAGGGVAGVVAVPVLMTVLSPGLRRHRDELWQSLGRVDGFPLGEVVKARIEIPQDLAVPAAGLAEKAVFVYRPSDTEIIVYARNCTDLSCPLTWDKGSGWFVCPCHGGIFTIEGEPVHGPPSRPMYRYELRIRNGVVEIDLNSLPPIT